MLLFSKLVDETQMSNPRDRAARDISPKFSIFLSLRAIYFRSYQYETPCTLALLRSNYLLLFDNNRWNDRPNKKKKGMNE